MITFEKLERLAPEGKSSVRVYDKETGTHVHKQIYRSFLSTGNVPEFDPGVEKSYMMSGFDESEYVPLEDLDPELKALFEHVQRVNPKYNQMTINWYLSGDEYIEMHRDCDNAMIDDYKISIFNYCNEAGNDRVFVIEGDGQREELALTDGEVITLDKYLNTEFRHGVPPSDNPESKRISVTFRQMKARGV